MHIFVVTTIYHGYRKFLAGAVHEAGCTGAVHEAGHFDSLESAQRAATEARKNIRWRGFNWYTVRVLDDKRVVSL